MQNWKSHRHHLLQWLQVHHWYTPTNRRRTSASPHLKVANESKPRESNFVISWAHILFLVDFGHTFTLALSYFVLFLPSFRLFVFVLVFVLFSLFFLNFFLALVLDFCLFLFVCLFFNFLFLPFTGSYFKVFKHYLHVNSEQICSSSDYYLWNMNCNCFRLPWNKFSVVGSLSFFVNQHSSPSPTLKSFMSYAPTQRHLLSLPTKWCSTNAGQLSLSLQLLFLHLGIIGMGQDRWQTCIFLW